MGLLPGLQVGGKTALMVEHDFVDPDQHVGCLFVLDEGYLAIELIVVFPEGFVVFFQFVFDALEAAGPHQIISKL